MDFGHDDLDQFFGEEACEEFVKGINVEFGDTDQKFLEKLKKANNTKEEKETFAAILVENDQMLKSAIFGIQNDEFEVTTTRNVEETVEILTDSSLANVLIPKDKEVIKKFIIDRFEHFEGKFSKD